MVTYKDYSQRYKYRQDDACRQQLKAIMYLESYDCTSSMISSGRYFSLEVELSRAIIVTVGRPGRLGASKKSDRR